MKMSILSVRTKNWKIRYIPDDTRGGVVVNIPHFSVFLFVLQLTLNNDIGANLFVNHPAKLLHNEIRYVGEYERVKNNDDREDDFNVKGGLQWCCINGQIIIGIETIQSIEPSLAIHDFKTTQNGTDTIEDGENNDFSSILIDRL